MRVEFNCGDFKKAVDRVLAVVPKKPSFEQLKTVKLEAKDDKVVVSGTDLEGYVKVYIDAKVIESGASFIMYDDIKKIYKLDGLVTLDADSEKQKCCTISNHKKKSTVPTHDYTNSDIEFPADVNEFIMEITEHELVCVLSELSVFLGSPTNRAMASYSFDGKYNRIVALDGHYLCIKNMKNTFKSERKVVVPGEVFPHIKKVANAKSNNIVTAYINNKYIKFCGVDFEYTYRLADCEYFNVDSLFKNMNDEFEFTVDSDEFKILAKDYKSTVTDENKNPMLMLIENDGLHTGLFMSDYSTADVVSGFQINNTLKKSLFYGFNPRYIFNSMQLFDGNVNVKGSYKSSVVTGTQNSPLVFHDDTYTVLILPVRTDEEIMNNFKSYISVVQR